MGSINPSVPWPVQSRLVSTTPVKTLTVAQAAAEHEQLVGQLQVDLLCFKHAS